MSPFYVYVVVGIFVDFDDTFAGSQLAVFAVRPSVVKVRVMDMAASFASASPSDSAAARRSQDKHFVHNTIDIGLKPHRSLGLIIIKLVLDVHTQIKTQESQLANRK